MNKYFTKYLPVEEEIKNNTTVYKEGLGYGVVVEYRRPKEIYVRFNDEPDEDVVDYDDVELKVVKLFLCSRDIQVGDKYLTAPDYTKERICEDNSYSFEHCLKVIGKVSPEAVWVTEGMEFEEEDVQVICYDGEDTWVFSAEEWKEEIEEEHSYLWYKIQIKCPNCEHFH